MKVIVLVLLITFVLAHQDEDGEDIQYLRRPETSNTPTFAKDFQRCPNNNQKKVCAVDANNIILKTYSDRCEACGDDDVLGYYTQECPSRNTYLCQFPRPSSCTNKNQPVCALKNDLTLKNYKNKCQACKVRGVKSYQFGTCEYPGV